MLRIIVFIMLLVYSIPLLCQNSSKGGFLPTLNLRSGIDDHWKLNFQIESRQEVFSDSSEDDITLQYDYILTDISSSISRKIGINNALATGYLVRLRDNNVIHRLTQQLTLTSNLLNFRLGHRMRSDQTFDKKDAPEFRFRYRITPEIPLNGLSLDRNEFYLKINNEYLNSFQKNKYDLEIRLVPLLGYMFSDNNKIESGIDYRISKFLNANTNHVFWLTIGWYTTL